MYGKLVRIGGRDIWISCNPNTPLSEILMRASEQVRREEDSEREAKPTRRIPTFQMIHRKPSDSDMTTIADWEWRAEYLRGHARLLRQKASEFEDEAAKFDGLAEQAEYLVIYEREKANAQTSG